VRGVLVAEVAGGLTQRDALGGGGAQDGGFEALGGFRGLAEGELGPGDVPERVAVGLIGHHL
jgi:hypothetical protein